ncbi:hypothetical protein PRBEI_2000948200 [Prionailurus iriomotensis]
MFANHFEIAKRHIQILLMETTFFCSSNHCSSQALYLACHFNLNHIEGKSLLELK